MASSQPPTPALQPHLRLGKTAQAYNSLQHNVRGELSLLQRRALILADGQRSVETLCQLLGPGNGAVLELLYQRGYLHEHGNGRYITPASGVISQGRPAPRPERSFEAARQHLLDLVGQHAEPVARGWEWQLQQAGEGDAGLRTLASVLDCLAPAMGERTADEAERKLPQLLPYAQLERLEQLRQSAAKAAVKPRQQFWY